MSNLSNSIIRVAVIQAGSVFMDQQATLEKAERLIRNAAKKKAQLIVFPEAFLSGYPRGLGFGTVVGSRLEAGRELFARYHASAIEIPSVTIDRLTKAARNASVYLVIGVVERDAEFNKGTLYCTILYFSPDGSILGKHRKLKPTAAERGIWGEGHLAPSVFKTDIGRLGGLICWENMMPLARTALYEQGVEIYVAPTADNRESWQSTIRHIACEGRCYVLACNQYMTIEMYPQDLQLLPELKNAPKPFCPGGSTIIDPMGNYLAGPLYGREGILFAELDSEMLVKSRFDFDVVGHYARPDVFRLDVKGK